MTAADGEFDEVRAGGFGRLRKRWPLLVALAVLAVVALLLSLTVPAHGNRRVVAVAAAGDEPVTPTVAPTDPPTTAASATTNPPDTPQVDFGGIDAELTFDPSSVPANESVSFVATLSNPFDTRVVVPIEPEGAIGVAIGSPDSMRLIGLINVGDPRLHEPAALENGLVFEPRETMRMTGRIDEVGRQAESFGLNPSYIVDHDFCCLGAFTFGGPAGSITIEPPDPTAGA